MFDYPRVHFECHAPEQNWRFCCLRTFQFYYVVRSIQGTHYKIKHFFANYQSFGLLFCSTIVEQHIYIIWSSNQSRRFLFRPVISRRSISSRDSRLRGVHIIFFRIILSFCKIGFITFKLGFIHSKIHISQTPK